MSRICQTQAEKIFAVIDTNVMVSSFLSSDDSPPVRIIEEICKGNIIPLYSSFLLQEYRRVLSDERSELDDTKVYKHLRLIQDTGYDGGVELIDFGCSLMDKKDSPIFDIVLSTRELDSYLVTGNTKHFPKENFVVTPKQMIDLIENAL
jgi:predicted nucleic acid-binding protein